MEKEKGKSSSVSIIILVLIILGLVGYIVYDKVLLNKEETSETTITENNENTAVTNDSTNVKNMTQVLRTKVGDIIVSTEGSVYYVPNIKFLDYHSDGKELNFSDSNKIGEYSKYKVNGYRLIRGTDEYEEFEGYKLDFSEITAAYECYFGNGGMADSILFITKSGKVNAFSVYIDIDDKANVKIDKDVTEHKNIVSILQSQGIDSSNALLIDKTGNKYEFNYDYSS